MKRYLTVATALALLDPSQLFAQPVDLPIPAATTDQYPPGVTVRQTATGPVYADAQGHTLYGMDMRTLIRWAPDPAKYCQGPCAQKWQPVLAPAGAKPSVMYPRGFGDRPKPAPGTAPNAAPQSLAQVRASFTPIPPGFITPQAAPDWAIIAGTQGPQWVYKGWHVVYTRKGDRPGSTAFDGADQLTWNTLKFVPPVPKLVAPSSVTTVFTEGAYALASKDGRVLFTGNCATSCSGWSPLTAPMAGRGIGEWAISLSGDSPQWSWQGKPVYVSQEDNPLKAPTGGMVLRP